VLKQRLGSRQVVGYELSFENNAPKLEIVAKRYADRSEGERSFRTMQMLWNAGLSDENVFRIPRPIAYFTDLRLMLQERAQGCFLPDRLGSGAEEVISDLRVVGRWLAELHSLAPPSAGLPSFDGSDDDEAAVTRFAGELGARHPEARDRISALASRLLEVFHSLSERPTAIVHGDFHPENVFVGEGTATVIDFDQTCTSDPARDLGYFTAQIRAKVLQEDFDATPFDHEIGAFLGAYLECVPASNRDSVARRTMAYAARTVLEILYYKLCVLKDHRTEVLAILPEEAERFIAADHPVIHMSRVAGRRMIT